MFETMHRLLQDGDLSVIESFELPGKESQPSPVPGYLVDTPVGDLLTQRYSSGLWAHQAKALESLGRGDNVVISTGTASGKSLIFRSFAFHQIFKDPTSRIVVFYPLLALAADQLRGWHEMAEDLGFDRSVVGRIDGTVSDMRERERIMESARIILMTPDVCHRWLMTKLAQPLFKRFLSSLAAVIMDEAHILEGVFGSNYGFFLRRLLAARNYQVPTRHRPRTPQLIAATATISNPAEHMRLLTGTDFSVVGPEDDGAQQHQRVVAHVACSEGDEYRIANYLQRALLDYGSEGGFITFVDSRKGVETLAMETAQDEGVDQLSRSPDVEPYRAGYTPEQRQAIERRLREGTLRGIVSTSALELGIDLPHLRVGLNVGVPSTRKAYRQRLGRIGRNGPGAFVVVGPPNAFTRYGTSFREYHEMSVEPSYLYLDNRFMQFVHGLCLSKERDALGAPSGLPGRVGWPAGFDDAYAATRPGGLRPREFDEIYRRGNDDPHATFLLRNLGERDFEIKQNQDAPRLGNASESQALRECYPGATYLHQGKAYEVRSWNTMSRDRPFVRVRNTSPHRRTRPRITTWVNAELTADDVYDDHLLRGEAGFLVECRIQFTEIVTGYTDERSGQFRSYRDLQATDSNMKSRSRNFPTSGVILCLGKDWFSRVETKKLITDRLHEIFAHEHSLLMHDVGSTATNVTVRDEDGNIQRTGCIALFDNTYGSLRFTEKLFTEFDHIIDRMVSAAESEAAENPGLLAAVMRLKEDVSDFRPATAGNRLLQDVPDGFELVFAPQSRVIYRVPGETLASEVTIVRAALIPDVSADGDAEEVLMYQVELLSMAGGTPSRRFIKADSVEASADVNAWERVWWNRATQEYEDPPEGEAGEGATESDSAE